MSYRCSSIGKSEDPPKILIVSGWNKEQTNFSHSSNFWVYGTTLHPRESSEDGLSEVKDRLCSLKSHINRSLTEIGSIVQSTSSRQKFHLQSRTWSKLVTIHCKRRVESFRHPNSDGAGLGPTDCGITLDVTHSSLRRSSLARGAPYPWSIWWLVIQKTERKFKHAIGSPGSEHTSHQGSIRR